MTFKLSTAAQTRKTSLIAKAEELGYDVRVDEDEFGHSIVCNHPTGGVVVAEVEASESGRMVWSLSVVDSRGNEAGEDPSFADIEDWLEHARG